MHLNARVSLGVSPKEKGPLTVGRMQRGDLVHHSKLKQEHVSRNMRLFSSLYNFVCFFYLCGDLLLCGLVVLPSSHTLNYEACLGNFSMSKLRNR